MNTGHSMRRQHSPEPLYPEHSELPPLSTASNSRALPPALKLSLDSSKLDQTLSQSAPTSPFLPRIASTVKPQSIPHASLSTAATPPLASVGFPSRGTDLLGAYRSRTGSVGGDGSSHRVKSADVLSSGGERLLFPHQRALSIQHSVSSCISPTSAVNGALPDAIPKPSMTMGAANIDRSNSRQSRRCSVAMSTNLSITQGLPIDPDRLDMDDDDSDGGYQSSGQISRGGLSSHGFSDIDEDLVSPGDIEAGSFGQSSMLSGTIKRPNDKALQTASSSCSTPRNKAFERLRSLVEEDKQALASEMEHEGQITRSIRHNSVQEWLRSSGSSPFSTIGSVPTGSSSLADDSSSLSTLAAPHPTVPMLRSSSATKQSRVLRTPTLHSQVDNAVASPDTMVGVPFPTSPASSVVSSPNLSSSYVSAVNSAGNVATIMYPSTGSSQLATGLLAGCAAGQSRKRKFMDDDNASTSSGGAIDGHDSNGCRSPGAAATDEIGGTNGPLAHHPYKRQAMSPSGLRVQVGMANGSKLSGSASSTPSHRRVSLAPKSNPSSPLLGSTRPIAVPVISRHQSHGLNIPAVSNPILHNVMSGGKSPGNRVRSRSGATLVGSQGNIMQANGVFSRMNISDKKVDGSSGELLE
ncbi:hypothetical protein GGI25_003575 [Coemansia spiralis]|uniref:Uncharacterized protein n=2 Tax=Coemansia TaxID=4863 RepID=A0A9W8G6F6_9FUNG|nr:hypothetical protein BX070DRAFT_253461 [Coemansia spiralis]KAJ1991131.1 hypothetical protein EDC05_003609 [Coemansia umbellata]KAJ2621292.1 hypothetical protein GGI26_004266 [Coemansia sp. RSA 1358]KAJ2676425.1 hypothetical protein GGI25_003575 [Coemansia spiralis]